MTTNAELSSVSENTVGLPSTATVGQSNVLSSQQTIEECQQQPSGKNDLVASSSSGSSSNNHDNQNATVAFDEMALEGPGLEEVESGKKKKVPRRIIHFVDGDTLEEYSTDEEEEETTPEPQIDPTNLDWIRWFWYWMVLSATKTLAGADFLGEKLAWFFGITTPKYQYVIDEYLKMKEEEEEERRMEAEEEAAELSEISAGQGHIEGHADVSEVRNGEKVMETQDAQVEE